MFTSTSVFCVKTGKSGRVGLHTGRLLCRNLKPAWVIIAEIVFSCKTKITVNNAPCDERNICFGRSPILYKHLILRIFACCESTDDRSMTVAARIGRFFHHGPFIVPIPIMPPPGIPSMLPPDMPMPCISFAAGLVGFTSSSVISSPMSS